MVGKLASGSAAKVHLVTQNVTQMEPGLTTDQDDCVMGSVPCMESIFGDRKLVHSSGM